MAGQGKIGVANGIMGFMMPEEKLLLKGRR